MSQRLDESRSKAIRRTLATVSLVSSCVSTTYYTTLVVFAVSAGLLSGATLGIALTIGAVLAPLASMWIGHRCDIDGAKRWVVLSYLAKGFSLVALVLAPTIPDGALAAAVFGAAIVVTAVAEHAVVVSQGAYIGVVLTGALRQKFSAQMRSLLNAGYLIGALAGSAAVLLGILDMFPIVGAVSAVVALGCGAAFFVFAFDVRQEADGSPPALRDFRYFLLAAFSGALATADAVLTVGVPIILVSIGALWGGVFPILMAVNALLVVVFQVKVAGSVHDPKAAARSMRVSAVASAAACVSLGIAVLNVENVVFALSLAILSSLIFAVSEMSNAAGTWWIRYNARTGMAQGSYGATFSLGSATGSFWGPAVVGILATSFYGYFALSAFYLVCAVVALGLVSWGTGVRGSVDQ